MSCPVNQFICVSKIIGIQADFDEDPIVRGRSIVLQSKDGHALWVSSSVIQASSPLPETVEGGVIVRNPSGQPIGQFTP
jgi:predicted amidohydrolase YtcJ